jgi:pimeloyl-ACP methyl ester carboxylesterase
MSQEATVVLIHGAFAESASWNGVISLLAEEGVHAIAAANPLRSVTTDGEYVADVIRSIDGPVILAGHSYGGVVATEASAHVENVRALVYVAAFAPDTGESAADLAAKFPGSTLGESLQPNVLTSGQVDLSIREDVFHAQFCADVDDATAKLMARTQRPITETALNEPLPTSRPGWKSVPSWFIYAGADRNIPAQAVAFLAERAGAREATVIEGAPHALTVSEPAAVARTILSALRATE